MTCQATHAGWRIAPGDDQPDTRSLLPDVWHNALNQVQRTCNICVKTHLSRKNKRIRLPTIGIPLKITLINTMGEYCNLRKRFFCCNIKTGFTQSQQSLTVTLRCYENM